MLFRGCGCGCGCLRMGFLWGRDDGRGAAWVLEGRGRRLETLRGGGGESRVLARFGVRFGIGSEW
jgi:hypothetical protein